MERKSKRIKLNNQKYNQNKIGSNNSNEQQALLNNLECKINKIGNICISLSNSINDIKKNQNILANNIENISKKLYLIDENLKNIGIEMKEQTITPISNDMMNAYG